MNKTTAVVAAGVIALSFAACGGQETVTVTQPSPPTTQSTPAPEPTPEVAPGNTFFTEEEVTTGYKDWVNENAVERGNPERVDTMECQHRGDNVYTCVAAWTDGSVLAADVTVFESGEFLAENVRPLNVGTTEGTHS